MCRLFGLLGRPSSSPVPWLLESDRSLLAQSHASEAAAQREGWGIGWYDQRRRPRVEKGIHGAFDPEERPGFEAAARAAHGPVVIAHLRRASNPMGLPRSRLVARENTQPFTNGSDLFAHNGEVSLPRETRPALGRYESRLQGVNDSEVLFWLLLRQLEDQADPLAAYSRARATLVEIWEASGRRSRYPFTGLNVLFSRGPNEIWAFCHWKGEHGPSLLTTDQPYYQMGYTTDTKMLVVGSEPFSSDAKGWRPLENGEYLVGQIDHGLVGVKTGPIP